jgi:hypothetical protein
MLNSGNKFSASCDNKINILTLVLSEKKILNEIKKHNLPHLTLGYMTKTLNHIIFFFLHQNQNIFLSNIGNQNIFLEKNHNPPFKLNGRSLKHKRKDNRGSDIKWFHCLMFDARVHSFRFYKLFFREFRI